MSIKASYHVNQSNSFTLEGNEDSSRFVLQGFLRSFHVRLSYDSREMANQAFIDWIEAANTTAMTFEQAEAFAKRRAS